MNIYFVFTPEYEEMICTYIYSSEGGKIISYSIDEDYIVKNEEPAIKSLRQIEDMYAAKQKNVKKGSEAPVLMKKEFGNINDALFFLEGTLDDFNNDVPARKKLPQIINPYDLDFDEEKDSAYDFQGEMEDDDLFEDDEFGGDDEADDKSFDDDDDYYR